MSDLIPGLGLASSVASGLYTALTERQRYADKSQLQRQQLAYERSLAERQTLSGQIQQAKSAGINPLHVLGHLPASAGIGGTTPPDSQLGAVSSAAGNVGQSIANYQNSRLQAEQVKAAQIDNITRLSENLGRLREQKARIDKLQADKSLSEEQRTNYQRQSDKLDIEISLLEQQFPSLVAQSRGQAESYAYQNNKTKAEEKEIYARIAKIIPAQASQLYASAKMLARQSDVLLFEAAKGAIDFGSYTREKEAEISKLVSDAIVESLGAEQVNILKSQGKLAVLADRYIQLIFSLLGSGTSAAGKAAAARMSRQVVHTTVVNPTP